MERTAERAVEVASFHQNDLRKISILSPSREKHATLAAAATATSMIAFAALIDLAIFDLRHVVIHAAVFFTTWLAVAVAVAVLVARRTSQRARTYLVGASLEADAFGSLEAALVQRGTSGYQLHLLPGMSGHIENGRLPLPIESLVAKGPLSMALPEQGRVCISVGPASWTIRHTTLAPSHFEFSLGQGLAAFGMRVRKSLPAVFSGLAFVLLVTSLFSTPAGRTLTEKDMTPALTAGATPWEIEQNLRAQAQRQASSLHACFDPMPLACQRPGYVGVGLSLSKEGDVLSHWISRSSYGADCPVSECMADLVARWFFEPVPDAMKLVLPIQVKRTNRPLQPSAVTISAGL